MVAGWSFLARGALFAELIVFHRPRRLFPLAVACCVPPKCLSPVAIACFDCPTCFSVLRNLTVVAPNQVVRRYCMTQNSNHTCNVIA
ncbi:hypothetical protein M5689_009738 [Euphorbia peplus]|nr:hypothetical protein M5689_009738 [Euphorbia peplus]